MDYCEQRCARCERCRFVSVSLNHVDCSWYSVCNSLAQRPSGFRTVQARRPKLAGQVTAACRPAPDRHASRALVRDRETSCMDAIARGNWSAGTWRWQHAAECGLGAVRGAAARRLLRCKKLLFMGSSVMRRHLYALLHSLLTDDEGEQGPLSSSEWRSAPEVEVAQRVDECWARLGFGCCSAQAP